MTLEDFERCTPAELDAIFFAYHQKAEDDYKDRWEMMRKAVTIIIQPHLKRKVNEKQLLSFPWDAHHPQGNTEETRPMTREEKKARFDELKQLLKNT